MADTETQWTTLAKVTDLNVGACMVVRPPGKQIALFHPQPDEYFAIDNQCPHEGYPLSKGPVQGEVVTCPWHNYKFDLRSGACLKGDEAVRSYPLRIEHGRIEVDLRDRPIHEQRAELEASLTEGLLERRVGQVARDVVRLLQLGCKPQDLALWLSKFDARYAEYGTTHVLPVAVDVLALAEPLEGLDAVAPLMQAFELAADTHVRRPPRPTPIPKPPTDDAETTGEHLAKLMESEQLEEAEARLRGVLEAGWGRAIIEPWFLRWCADHFLGFGHAQIYTVKAFDLLSLVGWQAAADVLPALLISIGSQTREDVLPEWRWFRGLIDAYDSDFAQWHAVQGQQKHTGGEFHELLLHGERSDCLQHLADLLQRGVSVDSIVNVLSAAASERLLRFDPSIDAASDVQESWLDVTHIVTYVNAIRYALTRSTDPRRLRLLFFAARFINHAKVLDRRELPSVAVPTSASLEALEAAIVAGEAETAVAQTHAYIHSEAPLGPLRQLLQALPLRDGVVRPIVVAHVIKNCAAAFDEVEHLGRGIGRPLEAYVQLVASPLRERRLGRTIHEAIRFVEHGLVPKTLT